MTAFVIYVTVLWAVGMTFCMIHLYTRRPDLPSDEIDLLRDFVAMLRRLSREERREKAKPGAKPEAKR